jgi:hypothetical protein
MERDFFCPSHNSLSHNLRQINPIFLRYTWVHYLFHAWTKHTQFLYFGVPTISLLSFPVFPMHVLYASHALGLFTTCSKARYVLYKLRVYILQNSITWLHPEIMLRSNTYVFIAVLVLLPTHLILLHWREKEKSVWRLMVPWKVIIRFCTQTHSNIIPFRP